MKIRIVSSKEEMNMLSPDEEIVHLAFRPSIMDILEVVRKCPHLKAIHISSSYMRTTSYAVMKYLKMQGIELLEGDVWGHRVDINEYSEISMDVCNRIKQCLLDGIQEVDILEKMGRETRLSPDFISFLIKNA